MPAGTPDGNWMGPFRGISLRLFDIFMRYRRCSSSPAECAPRRHGRTLINASSNHSITEHGLARACRSTDTFGIWKACREGSCHRNVH